MFDRLSVAALLVCVASRAAAAGPSTLIALTDEVTNDAQVEALRAEAAVRGLHIEIVRRSGSEAMANALGQRTDVAAVIWTTETSDGRVLHMRGSDGQTIYAPLDDAISARALAAVASSLLDELAPKPVAVDVNVDVKVRKSAPIAPIAKRESHERAPWFLTAGGLAAPLPAGGGIFAGHLGVGRYASEHIRGALLGHIVSIADKRIGAVSADVSWIQGSRLRTEVGARGVVVMIRDEGCSSCSMQPFSYVGFGAGGFLGLGFVTSIGTVFARVGADVVHFSNSSDSLTVTPSGALGFELPI